VLGGPLGVATNAVKLTEAHVTVEYVGELGQQQLAHVLGLVEPAGMDQNQAPV
jgi:hypothetical protein